ncbi:DJ-1/PfpI/YhbO family deglycase/protease [Limoniibacter endophyticus]|uniref:Protease n=1 Tax=Limoniibacter endophyticus TaxID=1565040 RepID=A0A8J3GFM4_9HYPH|nr:type 1 glutamine amidotransferase domain-containing protein [Limoniibacter endophyticus]GHC63798.1 protease [Limoniibacter endophyticus]
MPLIEQSKILILATDGYERSELRVPLDELKNRGATVHIASPKTDPIKSWDETDWGDTVGVDIKASDVNITDYDALVLPGGQINPDKLRMDKDAMRVVNEFVQSGKVIAAICHGPWLLAEADAVRDRKMTSFPSIKTDLVNAGAKWTDQEVVTDQGIITSRNPKDLPAFVAKIVEELREGRHQRHAA